MYVQNLPFGMHISLRHEAHVGSPATWSNASLSNANGGKRAPAKLSRKVYEAAVSERETQCSKWLSESSSGFRFQSY